MIKLKPKLKLTLQSQRDLIQFSESPDDWAISIKCFLLSLSRGS